MEVCRTRSRKLIVVSGRSIVRCVYTTLKFIGKTGICFEWVSCLGVNVSIRPLLVGDVNSKSNENKHEHFIFTVFTHYNATAR